MPTALEFVDVAGLVKGASAGEGLGNQFLATIRQCDAIVHVVRCFEDENVIHVDGSVDPVRDAELINLELAFADLAQVEKRLERIKKDIKTGKATEEEGSALQKIFDVLNNDEPARNADLDEAEELAIKSLGLLTRKKMIYAANVGDADLADGNEMVDGYQNRVFVNKFTNQIFIQRLHESSICNCYSDGAVFIFYSLCSNERIVQASSQ